MNGGDRINTNKFPPGWDEERVRRLVDYYKSQTEAIAEDKTAFAISWWERQALRAELGLPAEGSESDADSGYRSA